MYSIGGTSSTHASQRHGSMRNVLSSLCSKLWKKTGLGVKRTDLLSDQTSIYLPTSAATCFFTLEHNLDILLLFFFFSTYNSKGLSPSAMLIHLGFGVINQMFGLIHSFGFIQWVWKSDTADLLICGFTLWGISYPQSAMFQKYEKENSRNTKFISFRLHIILGGMMNFPTIWLHSAFDVCYLFVWHIRICDVPSGHLVAISVLR